MAIITTSHLFFPPLDSPPSSSNSLTLLLVRTDLSCRVKCIRDSSSASPHSISPFKGISFRRRKSPTTYNAATGDSDTGAGDSEDVSAFSASVEQGRKILALQKELLDQIAERKKIVSSLKENLSNATQQVEAFKDASDGVVESPITQNLVTKDESISVQLPNSDKTIQTLPVINLGESPSSVLKPSPTPKVLTNKNNKASQFSEIQTTAKPGLEIPVQNTKVESGNVKGGANDDSITTEEPAKPLAGPNVMNIIIVATECSPWVKTGGLGDVVGALPKALAARGHRVMVVVPRYSHYADAIDTGVRKRYTVAGQDHDVLYFHRYIDGVDYVFLESNFFNGITNNIYGGGREDVTKRMVLLCKAAIEVPWHVPCGGVCYGDGNLVFIANDWHTALLPVYLQAYYRDNGLMQYVRSILVIHNISHQGRGPLSDFSLLGLPDHYFDKFNLYDPVGGEHLNLLMAGLITAHRIVAVSHGYAWECQTQDGGWGLDGVMRNYNWKLQGIVNGIDGKEWSPEVDVHLKSDGYSNYSIDTLQTGKATCKAALQKELGLPVRDNVPIIGFIGRLDQQKGVDIIGDAMHWIKQQDVQLILLGTGRSDLEEMLRRFEGENRDKVRGWVGFSVKLAHRITAGCDILLMPSRFEPCGLNQLYAMRYGTIPVVHAVGGLRDTVQPFDPFSNKGTGWTFDRADPGAMIHALGNALYTYREFKDSWKALQERGMSQDLSWENAARQYEEVLVAAKYQW